MPFDLKSAVKSPVVFVEYRKGILYYRAQDGFGNTLLFPVPIKDTGDATFSCMDKGIYFMRFIRKHMDTIAEDTSAEEFFWDEVQY